MSPNALQRQPFKQYGWLPKKLDGRGLISLGQMLEVCAAEYVRIGSSMQSIQDSFGVDIRLDEPVPDTMRADVQRELALLIGSAKELNIATCVNIASRVHEEYKQTAPTYRRIAEDLRCIRLVFAAQLEERKFYFVPQERADYYCEGSPFEFLGPKMEPFAPVVEAFPSATTDILEAGNCFALARYTACVFHLMRVMEAGLKAIAKEMQVPYASNWGACISEIEKRSQADEFSKNAILYLRSVKNAWRNPTMHIEATYSQEWADRILQAVQVFMVHLTSRLAE
jgi:hypothetical protein